MPAPDSLGQPADSLILDTIPPGPRIDTFSLRISKDTLDAPVQYHADDSAVLLIKDKRFLLYGNTKTTYKDVVLTAPRVDIDQQTNILTAYNSVDSLGNTITRARFQQGEQGFDSDTIRYNFKTQKGLTLNTYTKQDEMFVNAQLIKKVNANTTFARRVTMTTCEYDHPHFGFVGNKGKFITDQVAVTGPIHPEFEGVPVPVYLPFGIFPLKRGRHSGLLPPQFTANEQLGLGLEGLGYYHVLNDYFDVTIRTNIYSYGAWTANITPTYRKRYRYNGSFNLAIQRTKYSFKGDPDYQLVKTFNVNWSHSVDPRARPGTMFSASVNAGSTRHNEYIPNNPYRNFQNQLTSSIAYSKNWIGKPFSLTLSANHTQNNATRVVNVILPDAGFTVTTLYPFQKKEIVGTPKWYEKIGVGYSGVARNMLSFYDTAANNFDKLLDTLLWGAQHRFPINMALPPLGPLLIAPSISYEQTWLTSRFERRWNAVDKKVDTIAARKGVFIDQQMSFGIGMNTNIYGLKQFGSRGLVAIRHVMRPNISFNYKPNLSKGNYDVIQVDTFGRTQAMPQFQGNLFSGYGYGKFGGLSFGLDNNLEAKWWGKKMDTTKKIRLIDGFGFSSAYNFLSDSLKLQPFNLYLRSTLFEKVSLTAQALLDPYEKGPFG
ncbi:MAG TPA: putative LPS assembly protein LptD, partial [Flavisolibacter sp.]